MASLEQLIQRQVNPFDPTTFKPGNFWQEQPNLAEEVNAIHQEVLTTVEQLLLSVNRDRTTRTVLLVGDSGSGKSYLLGRLKRALNTTAFFAYIGPWPDSHYIWRHVLRNTVDSLIHVPEGQTESQLMLWLRRLPSLQGRGLIKWMVGERNLFIRDMRASFPVGIYNSKEFFGVLYDLTNPELRSLAYDWLRGDDLNEEDLKALRVKQSIDSEDAAQKILSNIGRISTSTQPIVLCFDNLDNIPLLPTGKPDLQSLFNVNSAIHNEKLSNFLMLISVITSTWMENQKVIQPADLARITQRLALKPITLDQAEALWASRLADLHAQAEPKPKSAIAPLDRAWLEAKFPGGKTLPRNTLMLGQTLVEQFKREGKLTTPETIAPVPATPPPPPPRRTVKASFELVWQKEFAAIQQRIQRISQLSSPELVRSLREVLEALQIPVRTTPLLKGSKYAAYSLLYDQAVSTGLVWTEDRNLTTFYYVMNGCQKAIDDHRCQRLYLIRSEEIGSASNKGHQLYRQIFAYANYLHIQPDLASVHCLETYHSLVNAAAGGELVIGRTTPGIPQLQAMLRESGLLNTCTLLQELDLVEETGEATSTPPSVVVATELEPAQPAPLPTTARRQRKSPKASPDSTVDTSIQGAKQHLMNLMETQHLMGLQVLIQQTQTRFADLSVPELEQMIQQLCAEKRLYILDTNASPEEQLICLVP